MQVDKPTRALAAFAAHLDPVTLPANVGQKLGWLLLDYLRVCSIGERLPWAGWGRGYIDLVGKAGKAHALFSSQMLNPQHATFMNVTFGSRSEERRVGKECRSGWAGWQWKEKDGWGSLN